VDSDSQTRFTEVEKHD